MIPDEEMLFVVHVLYVHHKCHLPQKNPENIGWLTTLETLDFSVIIEEAYFLLTLGIVRIALLSYVGNYNDEL